MRKLRIALANRGLRLIQLALRLVAAGDEALRAAADVLVHVRAVQVGGVGDVSEIGIDAEKYPADRCRGRNLKYDEL